MTRLTYLAAGFLAATLAEAAMQLGPLAFH